MKTLEDCIDELTAYPVPFLELLRFLIPHEVVFQHGHYGDYDFVATEHDPNDPGGETRFGLDAASHPHLDIDGLTFADAAAEYHSEIWLPLRCDEMATNPAIALCDAAINCGTVRAVKWLQAAAQVTQDGNIGPQTLRAVDMVGPEIITKGINDARDDYYRNQVRPSLRALYLKGWESRLSDLIALTEPADSNVTNVAQIA